MITEEKLKKLYESVNNGELTTSVLNECGFTAYDIRKLINDCIIERKKRGFYQLERKDNNTVVEEPVKSAKNIISDLKLNEKISLINRNNVAILLEPISKDNEKSIISFIKKQKNLSYIIFNLNENESQIVIKRQKGYNKYVDLKQRLKEANIAFEEENYVTCIELLNNVISYFKVPASRIFEMLGNSYSKLGEDAEAFKYLTIAQGVSKIEEIPLKSKKTFDNGKDNVRFQNNKAINFLGITNMEEIAYSIYVNNGNVDEACKDFDLSLEEIMLIKLTCARVFYYDKNETMGDKLLLQVEKTKGKTDRVKYYLGQTRKNKLFYRNRENEEGKKLAIILQNKQQYKQ